MRPRDGGLCSKSHWRGSFSEYLSNFIHSEECVRTWIFYYYILPESSLKKLYCELLPESHLLKRVAIFLETKDKFKSMFVVVRERVLHLAFLPGVQWPKRDQTPLSQTEWTTLLESCFSTPVLLSVSWFCFMKMSKKFSLLRPLKGWVDFSFFLWNNSILGPKAGN